MIVSFFRDFLSGFRYYLYLALCILAIFYVLGIIGDRKRLAIAEKLKAKKKYDIESGKEAAIAALESKQVLDVMEDNQNNSANSNDSVGFNSTDELVKKEEVPSVVVLNSNEINNSTTQSVSNTNVNSTASNDLNVQNINPVISPVVNNDSININS